MKYNSSFFKDDMPLWKRKKDPLFVKLIYRPLSFEVTAFFANHGIKANIVTLISLFPAMLCGLFLSINNYTVNIIGSLFLSVWLLLDCADGNLARSVERQPYGDFLDALGSYFAIAFLGIGLGLHVFHNGGIFFDKYNYIVLVAGGLVSASDLLMRAVHQNYTNATQNLVLKGIVNDKVEKESRHEEKKDLITIIKLEFGIGGIIPPVLFVASIVGKMDYILLYLLVYNVGACVMITALYVKRTLTYLNIKL